MEGINLFLFLINIVLVFLYIIVVIVLVMLQNKNTNKQLFKRIIFFFSVKTGRVFITMSTNFTKLSQQYNNII